MANEQNLKPIRSTKEAKEKGPKEAKEKGRKGGIKSGIMRNKQKDFNELLKAIAHQEITDDKIKKELAKMGLDNDIRNYVIYKLYDEAVNKQNLKAIIKLFDALRVADGLQW